MSHSTDYTIYVNKLISGASKMQRNTWQLGTKEIKEEILLPKTR